MLEAANVVTTLYKAAAFTEMLPLAVWYPLSQEESVA
jgi:hypothetical protein